MFRYYINVPINEKGIEEFEWRLIKKKNSNISGVMNGIFGFVSIIMRRN